MKFKDKRILILFSVLLLLTALYIYKNIKPVLSYDLTMLEESDNIGMLEKPLQISNYNEDSINFDMTFGGALNEYEEADLKLEKRFLRNPPFIEYGKIIRIVIKNKDVFEERRVVYHIKGTISNLGAGDFKLRVEDSKNNLIDEKNFVMDADKLALEEEYLDVNVIEEMINNASTEPGATIPSNSVIDDNPKKSCLVDNDCMPVSCDCGCTGCGGFYYDEIINRKYEEVWYYERSCKKPEVCVQVCCEPVRAKCVSNVCTAIKDLETPLEN